MCVEKEGWLRTCKSIYYCSWPSLFCLTCDLSRRRKLCVIFRRRRQR